VEGRHFLLVSCGEGRGCCDSLSWGIGGTSEMVIQNLSFVGLALDVQSCKRAVKSRAQSSTKHRQDSSSFPDPARVELTRAHSDRPARHPATYI
jgi:hypothetical protein